MTTAKWLPTVTWSLLSNPLLRIQHFDHHEKGMSITLKIEGDSYKVKLEHSMITWFLCCLIPFTSQPLILPATNVNTQVRIGHNEVLYSRFVNKPMLEHDKQTAHCIALSYSDLSVWCFTCDSYLDALVVQQPRPAHEIAYWNLVKPHTFTPYCQLLTPCTDHAPPSQLPCLIVFVAWLSHQTRPISWAVSPGK